MLQLVAVLRTSAAMKLRLMAGVLLRGLADVTLGVWAKGSGLTPESREQSMMVVAWLCVVLVATLTPDSYCYFGCTFAML